MTTVSPRLLIASSNVHKLAELRALLDALSGVGRVELVAPSDFPGVAEPEESGATFEENALFKARYWAGAAGMLALADDSGLVVDALDGRPGVLSARYAADAQARNRRVLAELEDVPAQRRAARFVCVAALADPAGGVALRRGVVEGRIAQAPRGDGGFGYDPIFELVDGPHAGRAMAELSEVEKNALSHRGRALRAIAPVLVSSLAAGRVVETEALEGPQD
jgi:XTP/dITP diphosphohydrolase